MNTIKTAADLKAAIQRMENIHSSEWNGLRQQFLGTFESLKPANLFNDTLNHIAAMPELKEKVLNATLSLAAGFLSKKVLVGATHNPILKLVGTILEMGIAILVSKNTDDIKSGVMKIINTFSRKSKAPEPAQDLE